MDKPSRNKAGAPPASATEAPTTEATAPVVAAPAVTAAPEAPVPEPARFTLSLEEFCARKSERDRRVELIAAFHMDESRAGISRDAEEAFEARFDAFRRRPV